MMPRADSPSDVQEKAAQEFSGLQAQGPNEEDS